MAESRQVLLQWINELLALNITKLEQLGTGAAYCQLMDAIYGGVPLQRINFNARSDFEISQNYKLLQTIFARNKIARSFDAGRLSKCRLQDNLELCQWMYRQWHDKQSDEHYDGAARREAAGLVVDAGSTGPGSNSRAGSSMGVRAMGGARSASGTHSASGHRSASGSRQSTTIPGRPSTVMRTRPDTLATPGGGGGGGGAAAAATPVMEKIGTGIGNRRTSGAVGVGGSRRISQALGPSGRASSAMGMSANSARAVDDQNIAALEATNAELEQQLAEHESALVVVGRERTLYYSKLLEIENLVQKQLEAVYEQNGPNAGMNTSDPVLALTRKMQEILYATTDGFETPFRPEDEPF